jgi:septal ring factor EnvC (AmiA/AmiB activator)
MLGLFTVMLASAKFAELAPIISTFLGGGILGGVAVILRASAERDTLQASASRTAIDVFQASVDSLRHDLDEARSEAAALTHSLTLARARIDDLANERAALQSEVNVLRHEVIELRRRIS